VWAVNNLSLAVWECLKNNDPEGVVEVIEAHLRAKNKTELAKKNSLPRTTLHHAFKGKNPTVRTLAKLINCCA
jgi:DNA-binding phage protein